MLRTSLPVLGSLCAIALQGCGLNPGPAPPPSSGALMASDFSVYPGYTGSSDQIAATVLIGEPYSLTQSVSMVLNGGFCSGGSGANNVCGYHVHEGTSCDASGGHYFNGGTDPWIPFTYQTDPGGFAGETDKLVQTGYSASDMAGRAFVIHDDTGARAACALLVPVSGPTAFTVDSFSAYPGYTGSLTVTGTAAVVSKQDAGDPSKNTQVLQYSLSGADPVCSAGMNGPLFANSCGIHIHETSGGCAGVIGGHLWADGRVGNTDPWRFISYRTETPVGNTPPVVTGLLDSELVGKIVVVHDNNGDRIACGDLVATTSISAASQEQAPGASPLVWLSAILGVSLSLAGGAWYYGSKRRGYATQQDDPAELKDAAEMHTAA